MATARPLAAPLVATESARPQHDPDPALAAEQALVAASRQDQTAGGVVWRAPLLRLPVEVDVSVPVRNFRVRNLLALEPAQVIESDWGHGDDVLLASGEVQLAWSEFEVIDTQLAVRLTRLA